MACWMYDPKTGEGKIFEKEKDAPKGWVDTPAKVKAAPAKKAKAKD
jgi:hypothetical protein